MTRSMLLAHVRTINVLMKTRKSWDDETIGWYSRYDWTDRRDWLEKAFTRKEHSL